MYSYLQVIFLAKTSPKRQKLVQKMQKSIYSVGKKQKNLHENNIEKHSEKIKNSNYVFLLLENYL